MRNILTDLSCLCGLFSGKVRLQPKLWLVLFLLTLFGTSFGQRVVAQVPTDTPQTPINNAPQPPATAPQPPATAPQPPVNNAPQPPINNNAPQLPVNNAPQTPVNNAPPELTNLISQIDAAANARNIEGVLQFYSPNFTHSDGLTRQNMAQALTQLWQRYPQLKYQTQLRSWKPQGNAIVAETITNITGAQPQELRNIVFDATIESRQRYEGGKVVQQEILSERSQIKAGDKPPTVNVKLPEQVKPGQQYNFDAVVQEPLGDDYLLGAVIEEPIKPENYLNASRVDLELLTAGGLFKVGRAPNVPSNQWISAILIRGDGMTLVSQRLNVEGQNRSDARKPTVKSQNIRVQPSAQRNKGEGGKAE